MLAALLLSGISLSAQTYAWSWARNGLTDGTEGYAVASDSLGNVFSTGFAIDTLVFGNDTVFATPPGLNVYLVKYDGNGNLLWAKGANGNYVQGFSVATDGQGDAYVTGHFATNSVIFDSDTLHNPGNNSANCFLTKYSGNGNVLWARSANTSPIPNVSGRTVVTDHSGNVYELGYFWNIVAFGSDTLYGNNHYTTFLVKYDANGNVLWARQGINAGTTATQPTGMSVDPSDHVYITGFFSGSSVTFGSNTLTTPNQSIFVVKYDAAGNEMWAVDETSPSINSGALINDQAGNVYVTGSFVGSSIAFGSHTVNATYTGGSLYLTKYDTAGNVIWAKGAAGNADAHGGALSLNANNEIYITGAFGLAMTGNLVLGSYSLSTASGTDPIFVAKLDTAGNVLYATALPSGGDDFMGIAADAKTDCAYVGGDLAMNPCVIGNDTLVNGPGEYPFVAKWCYTTTSNSVVSLASGDGFGVNVFPNPVMTTATLSFHLAESGMVNVTLFDVCGKETGIGKSEMLGVGDQTIQLDLSDLASGIYLCKVITELGETRTLLLKK